MTLTVGNSPASTLQLATLLDTLDVRTDLDSYSDKAGQLESVLTSKGYAVLGDLYEFDRSPVLPVNAKVFSRFPGISGFRLSDAATSKQVVSFSSGSEVHGCVLDGNLTTRAANGNLTDYVFGGLMQNTQKAKAVGCVVKDAGGTDTDFATFGGNGGGFLIEMTTGASADVSSNQIVENVANLPKAGFHTRILTPFQGYSHGTLPFYAVDNLIHRNAFEGGRKNVTELCGPNTRGNYVTANSVKNPKGQGGIEADFGAFWNYFLQNHILFDADFLLEISHDCYSQRRSNGSDGGRSFGNLFGDCLVTFLGQLTGAANLNGFAEVGSSSGARFMNPKINAGFSGGSVSTPFRKASGATGIVSGYLQQATLGKNRNTLISGAEFINVDRGVKVVSSSGADQIVMKDSHVYARGAWYENSGSGTVDKMLFTGESYLQSVGASATTGSGTTTALTYDANVRQQLSATSPIA